MANPVLGKSLCPDWFFLGQDFAVRTVSKFKICNQNSEKTVKLPEEAKKIEIFPTFQRWMKKTNILQASFIILETFDVETETGITECHIINLLTELARAVLGNIGPRSWQQRPSEARSVVPRPQANIPQYSPRARLVSG